MPDVSRLRELAISDAGFVFDPLSGRTYNLNDTALTMLLAIKAGEPAGAIVARVRDQFELEPEDDVARDLEEFLSRLREHDLVR